MSHWNPIESAKNVAKDVKDLASDACSTSKKIFDDAYDLGKTAVKGTGVLAKDAVATDLKVVADIVHGDLKSSAADIKSGFVKAASEIHKTNSVINSEISHTLHDATSGLLKTGSDLNHFAIDAATVIDPHAGDAVRLCEAFGGAAINSAVLQPIDAVSQLVSAGVKKSTGYELPKLSLAIAPDVEGLGTMGKIATIAGSAAGYLAPVLLTGGATSSLAGLAIATKSLQGAAEGSEIAAQVGKTASVVKTVSEHASVASEPSKVSKTLTRFLDAPQKSTADGAVAGFVFTPGKDGKVDLSHRMEAAAINGAAFGSITATSRVVHNGATSVAGPSVEGVGVVSATESSVRHLLSSTAGGIAGEETKSLAENRHLATPNELVQATNEMVVKDVSSASADRARLSVSAALK